MNSLLEIKRPKNPRSDKVIVLDIDETLVHTFEDHEIFNDSNLLELKRRIYHIEIIDIDRSHVRGSGFVYQMSGIMRPYMKEFLEFCFKYFRFVTIWSAGTYSYVHSIVNEIFRDLPYPDVV